MNIVEPTIENCDINAIVFDDGKSIGYAMWHPQIGGYSARAVVVLSKQWFDYGHAREGGCFDIWVWHDGEFPSDEPYVTHYCDPEQFIEFGQKIKALNELHRIDRSA